MRTLENVKIKVTEDVDYGNMFRPGGHYKLDEYDLVYVMETRSPKNDNKIFLMRDMGSGKYKDTREYMEDHPEVAKLQRRWKGVVCSLRIPGLKDVQSEPFLRKKMGWAIRRQDSGEPRFAWLRDVSEDSHGAWCVGRRGELYVGHKEGRGSYLLILTIAPYDIRVEDGRILRKTK